MPSSSRRRQVLLDEMKGLENKEVDCRFCPGKCCTFISNSMQVTPSEALDLMSFLKRENRWNEELKQKLLDCISEYRLDYHLDTGGGSGFRRTYTCPFFAGHSLGCTIEKDSNPYGCLGFNASESGEKDGRSCYSNQDILKAQENSLCGEEKDLNHEFEKLFPKFGKKLPIPNALLFLFETDLDTF